MVSVAIAIPLLLPSRWARADTRTDARRYFQQGMLLIDEGKHTEGILLLKKAYSIRPHASVLFNIARAYTSIGAVDESIAFFERYLETDPADGDRVEATLRELRERRRLRAVVDEGMSAIAEGRYTEGIALLRRAYDARPHPNILFNIARAYEDAREFRRAIATFERYLRTSPPDAEDVQSRLKRLKGLIARRSSPARGAGSERPREEAAGRVRAEPGPKPAGENEPPAPVLQELDETDMERLAEMVAAFVRREEAGSPAGRSRMAPGGDVAQDDPAAIDVELEGREARSAAGGSRTSTAGDVSAGPTLEAKSGAAYEEVVITASRREQSPLDAPNAVTILTDEDIRLSGARSVPDMLRRVPGMDVMAMSYSDYNVAMRGFNRRIANKILVLVDGRTVYEDFLGGMVWRGLTIDLADIARIEVVRGPGSAIYGAYAYTGTVNIITKRPEEIGGSVLSAASGNGKTLEGTYQYGERRGPIGFRATIGYERGNKYELEFDPARVDFTTNVADPSESLDQVRMDVHGEYNLKGAGRIYLGGGARSGAQEIYGVAALRNQAIDGRGFNVRAGYAGELVSLLAFWNGLRAESTPQFYRTGLPDLGSKVRADVVSVEPVFRPSFRLLGEHALVVGGEYRHKFIEWDYLDGPHDEDHFAAFVQDSWEMSRAVGMIASARLDLHPILGPLASPRVAVIFKPAPRQALRASIGTAYRQPTIAETYLDLSSSSPIAGVAVTLVGGGEALEPENIATLDLGYLFQPEFGEIETVVYANRVGNLITRSPLEPPPPEQGFRRDVGAFIGGVSRHVNETRHFIALGTELSVRFYPVEGVDVGATYAFQHIFDEDTGDRFTDSPLHKASVWGTLRTAFGMDLGASVHFVSSQDWIEPSYDPSDPTGFDSAPLPLAASVVAIGRVGYRLFGDKLELGVSGTNLTDFGDLRHREHPFGNRVEARVLGSVIARF